MRTVYVVTLEHDEDEFPVLAVNEGRIVSVLSPDEGLAVERTSPGGRSLTYCCCDRTVARLVICPTHPDGPPAPDARTDSGSTESVGLREVPGSDFTQETAR